MSEQLQSDLNNIDLTKQVDVDAIAKQIEDEQVRQLEESSKDPVAVASAMFMAYLPEYLDGISRLSSNGKTRLLKNLAEYPMKIYKAQSPLEERLLALGDVLGECKFTLRMAQMNYSPEQLKDGLDAEGFEYESLSEEAKAELNNFMNKDNNVLNKKETVNVNIQETSAV
jgi:hypothetical protein